MSIAVVIVGTIGGKMTIDLSIPKSLADYLISIGVKIPNGIAVIE